MKKYHSLFLALAILGLLVPNALVWAQDLSSKQLAQIDQAAEKAALKQQIQEEETVYKFFQILRVQEQSDIESFAARKVVLHYSSCPQRRSHVPSSINYWPATDYNYNYPKSKDGPWDEMFTDGRSGKVGITYVRKGFAWRRIGEGSKCYADDDRYSKPLEHKKLSLPDEKLQKLVNRRQRIKEKRQFLVQIGVPERYAEYLDISEDDSISISPTCELFGDGYIHVKEVIRIVHKPYYGSTRLYYFYMDENEKWNYLEISERYGLKCYSRNQAGQVKEEPWRELLT